MMYHKKRTVEIALDALEMLSDKTILAVSDYLNDGYLPNRGDDEIRVKTGSIFFKEIDITGFHVLFFIN